MKNAMRTVWLAMIAATCLACSQTASAFYNPSTGRWLSRDPANEPGFVSTASFNSVKPALDAEEQELESNNSGDASAAVRVTGRTNDLLYVFAQNNPRNLIDGLGLTVFLQAHPVHLAFGFNHSKVTMVIDCSLRWLGVPPLTNPMPGHVEQFYGTIGAGPQHHKLTKGLNRQWDIMLWRNVFSAVISPPGGVSDDDFIGLLLAANVQYQNNLPYAALPTRAGPGYNSNGYASGIFRFVTGSMPPRPPHTPGFNKPVPAQDF